MSLSALTQTISVLTIKNYRSMKTNYLLLVTTICAALWSCSKEPAQQPAPGCPKISNELTITAKAATKTALNGTSVVWRNTDVLVVFDNDGTGVQFATEDHDAAAATFTTTDWTGKTPMYASSSQAGAEAAGTPAGLLTVKLDPQQNIHAIGTYGANASASVGKITDNVGTYSIEAMKNVMGLVEFTLKTNVVASIEVESVGGEKVAGFVDVDYALLVADDAGFWTATASKEQSSRITLLPVDDAIENGTFKAGVYYVSLLPQKYAQGLKFTLKDKDGAVLATRKIGTAAGLTIGRSVITKTEGFLDSVDKLPATVTLELKFNDKPMGATLPDMDQQDSKKGEVYQYSYMYTYEGAEETETFDYVICKGTNATTSRYRYLVCDYDSPAKGTTVMRVDKAWAWIKTPAIAGRTLQSVTLSLSSTGSKGWKVRASSGADDIKAAVSKGATTTELNTQTLTFYKGEVAAATPYYIFFLNQNTDIVSVKLVYSKEISEAPATE